MLMYRGDKFVKDKKFTINENVYRFKKRDNKDNLVFESADGTILKLTESDFNNRELKEEANGYSEASMINTIKSYYEDGNEEDRDMANMFIATYATEPDKYPELYAYVKKLLDKNHNKESEQEEHNPFDVGSAISSVAKEYGINFDDDTPFENFYAPDSDGEDEDDKWYSDDYDWASFYDKILHDLGYGENPILNDCKAEVHEISDGKYEMNLDINGNLYTVDLRAWDKLEDIKANVQDIIEKLS